MTIFKEIKDSNITTTETPTTTTTTTAKKHNENENHKMPLLFDVTLKELRQIFFNLLLPDVWRNEQYKQGIQ